LILAKIVKSIGLFSYMFFCPGCGHYHGIRTAEDVVILKADPNLDIKDRKWLEEHNWPAWTFNGDMDKPTVSPSILIEHDGKTICHSFVKNGQIQFLQDCDHKMKGQTVELPEEPL
jgi:hypothetical protein